MLSHWAIPLSHNALSLSYPTIPIQYNNSDKRQKCMVINMHIIIYKSKFDTRHLSACKPVCKPSGPSASNFVYIKGTSRLSQVLIMNTWRPQETATKSWHTLFVTHHNRKGMPTINPHRCRFHFNQLKLSIVSWITCDQRNSLRIGYIKLWSKLEKNTTFH